MTLNLSLPGQDELKPRITVFGVGGAGGNAVNNMIDKELGGVDFVVANTDAQALQQTRAEHRIQLGIKVTEGLGAGARASVGAKAAEESIEQIVDHLAGAHMCFITAGMGGGTGTGAAPVVAQIAREMGVLTVAVVTKPFPFEGKKRMSVAEEGIRELEREVDSLITIPNEKLLAVLGQELTLLNAFKSANDVLLGAVKGIAELITRPGLINVDFADVRTVMSEMGMAVMGSGESSGEGRAREAAERAIACPLLEDANIAGANGVLVNVTAGLDLSIGEFDEVGNAVKEFASDEATVVVGTVIDPELEGEIRVTVVATGLAADRPAQEPEAAPAARLVPRKAASGDPASETPERPAARQWSANGSNAAAAGSDMEYLDIPAFLRRQAD